MADAIHLTPATPDDAPALVEFRDSVARALTDRFGNGPWTRTGTVRGVLLDMRRSRVFVARDGERLIASLALSTRKPWAINPAYFTPCARPLYLTSMAVAPDTQRAGIGRQCLDEARSIAREWPADMIRLDAFDADAGAGEFYSKCGFREAGRTTYRGCPLIYYEIHV